MTTPRNQPLTSRATRELIRLIRFLSRPNTYTVILLTLLVLLFLGTVVVWLLEQQDAAAPGLQSLDDSFIFMLQNVSGVSLGSQVPHSAMARYTGVLFIIVAAALRAVFVAAVVSGFVNRLLLHGKGLRRVNLERHIIICGWNPRVRQVVDVLKRKAYGQGVPIVMLAQIKENPLVEQGVKLVTGNPSDAADLERAGVYKARSAVVITDESDGQPHSDSTFDARGVLTVLALKSANSNLHVVAQVRDPANRPHFRRARVDEMIVSAEMSEGLLARAAVNLGIAGVYEDLLRLDTVPEIYVIDAPEMLEGKTFQAALVHYSVRENSIVVGVVEKGEVCMCPANDYPIGTETRLVVLGKARPALDH